MVQQGGAPGGRGGARLGDPLTLYPPGGSSHSVRAPGDLMLTYGVSYYLASDDSHFDSSSLDSPQTSPFVPSAAVSPPYLG